jgi:hypothetical protein
MAVYVGANGRRNHVRPLLLLNVFLRNSHHLSFFVCPCRHVMVTARPKTPGEVCDPTGIGNDDFDRGLKASKFGYPVLGLYQLKTPLKPAAMKEFGLSTPQGLMYATKKLIEGMPLEDMDKLF